MEKNNILVTGGGGYIGSFMVRALLEKGYGVVVVDNLARGNKNIVNSNAIFKQGDVGDSEFVTSVLDSNKIKGVIHFAGFISMGESMQKPGLYFQENTYKTVKLLDALASKGVMNIIFSSTAGVYGNPITLPIPETHSTNPSNPYGESKLMVEKVLYWYRKIFGLSYAALRYFNACGASINGEFGEMHSPETHIIPAAMNAAKSGKDFSLYGKDYPTKDGTCVRDYIHVLDLVDAHLLALEKITKEPGGYVFNVGTGKGFSNLEVLNMIQEVTGKKLHILNKERRPGDASELVADVSKIKNQLGFSPKYSDLKTIVESAWKWHSKT